MKVRLCIENSPPWVVITFNNGKPKWNGMLVNTIARVLTSMKTNLTIIPYKNEELRVFPNETWTGLIGRMQRNECDVIADEYVVTYERFRAVDFSSEITATTVVMISSIPPREELSMFSRLLTIDSMVFLGYFVSYVVIVLMSKAAEGCSSRRHSTCWKYYATIFSKPLLINLVATPARLILASWLLAVVILSTLVNNTLITQLLVPGRGIDSLEDILKRPNMQPIILKGTFLEELYCRSEDPLRSAIWRQVILRDGLKSQDVISEEAQSIVRGESVLLNGEHYIFGNLVSDCDGNMAETLYKGKQEDSLAPASILLRKGLDRNIKTKLNNEIRFLAATCQFEWVKHVSSTRLEPCLSQGTTVYQSAIKLTEVSLTFWIFSGGTCLSFVVLILEKVFKRFLEYYKFRLMR